MDRVKALEEYVKTLEGQFTDLVDVFYPIGSYYETSDTNFNPNDEWGGEWSLESGGKFHLSAGGSYTAGSTGGSENAIIPYHRHGKGELEGTTPTLSASKGTFVTSASEVGAARGTINSSSSASYYYARSVASGTNWGRATPTIASGKTITISGNTAYVGTSGNITGANMPPYIVVNRWHRTG